MRILLISILSTTLAVSVRAQTTPASPQTATAARPARPACNGRVATVRVSTITPNGSMEGFLKAMAAHKEWYRSHGQPDHEIFGTRILVRDAATKAQTYSDKQIMTFHIHPKSNQPEPAHDDAYEAFVKLYRDNSEITQQYNVCMPDPGQR